MGISINQLNITIMERYDYLEAVKEDVLNYINENNIVVTSENRTKWNRILMIYYLYVIA